MRSIVVVQSFSWKTLVTDLMSVILMIGCGVPQNMSPNFLNAKIMARNSLTYMGIFISEVVYVLEPYAPGAWVLRVDVNFWFGLFSVSTAYRATGKLASVLRFNFLSGDGPLSAN